MIRLAWADSLGVSGRRPCCYRLAGSVLTADMRVGMLDGLELRCAERPDQALAPEKLAESGADEVTLRARGWIAGDTREVSCASGRKGYAFDIAGIGRFSVARSGDAIRCRELAPGLPAELAEEALLGPPLALALALRGTWCLHASAVLVRGAASLFLGPSGCGKSTLAAYLDQAAAHGARRIADDILPCSLQDGEGQAWPHFPQLKLPPSRRYALDAPQRLPLRSLVLLEAAASDSDWSVEPVQPAAAIRELANQTVAANLYDRHLHELHLQFLAGLVQTTPVFRLRYPHDFTQLPAVAAGVTAYIMPASK